MTRWNTQIGIDEQTAVGDAGVIDQHVDAAETLDGQGRRRIHRGGVGNVAAQAQRLDVEVLFEVLHQAVQRRPVEVEDHRARAGLGETQRQGAADAEQPPLTSTVLCR
jgi:hypothetical protein